MPTTNQNHLPQLLIYQLKGMVHLLSVFACEKIGLGCGLLFDSNDNGRKIDIGVLYIVLSCTLPGAIFMFGLYIYSTSIDSH